MNPLIQRLLRGISNGTQFVVSGVIDLEKIVSEKHPHSGTLPLIFKVYGGSESGILEIDYYSKVSR